MSMVIGDAEIVGHTVAVGFERVAELPGGGAMLQSSLASSMDTHALIRRGLPSRSAQHLIAALKADHDPVQVARVLGMSVRTVQRLKATPDKRVSLEVSRRTWQFAEILALTNEVLGSQDEAEAWLEEPALALDQARPIDLLETPTGLEMVRVLLSRIAYGVYSCWKWCRFPRPWAPPS